VRLGELAAAGSLIAGKAGEFGARETDVGQVSRAPVWATSCSASARIASHASIAVCRSPATV